MNLLLDTHIWLWSLAVRRNLSPSVRRALASPRNELWLSPISVWEVFVLSEKGRIRLGTDPQAWFGEAMERAPVREAPLTFRIAMESRLFDLPHEDPADRFLAATARVLDLTLVTADERLLRSRRIRTLANR